MRSESTSTTRKSPRATSTRSSTTKAPRKASEPKPPLAPPPPVPPAAEATEGEPGGQAPPPPAARPDMMSRGHVAGFALATLDDLERVRVELMYALDALEDGRFMSPGQAVASVTRAMLELWRAEGQVKALSAEVVGESAAPNDSTAELAPRLAKVAAASSCSSEASSDAA